MVEAWRKGEVPQELPRFEKKSSTYTTIPKPRTGSQPESAPPTSFEELSQRSPEDIVDFLFDPSQPLPFPNTANPGVEVDVIISKLFGDYILDSSNTGLVNQHKFSEFLKCFGPLGVCSTQVREMLCQPWFFGFLSKKEAELLLSPEQPGTFLIRFSKSKPGNLALAFADQKGRYYHILIKRYGLLEPSHVAVRNQMASESSNRKHEPSDYFPMSRLSLKSTHGF